MIRDLRTLSGLPDYYTEAAKRDTPTGAHGEIKQNRLAGATFASGGASMPKTIAVPSPSNEGNINKYRGGHVY